MPETFVPLLPNPASGAGFVPFDIKVSTPFAAVSREEPEKTGAASSHSPENCPTPKITLRRANDVVSEIRIECACGQIIELVCKYQDEVRK
ncbi:MAG TPA: hypothetical protein VFM25_02475 [Verrucomicrobiae bacterium]|nr:hypothetical protein [Verrucomicrobiae bacterium]